MLETREAIRLLENKIIGWLRALVDMLPNIVVASLVVLLFWLGARLLRNLGMRLVRRLIKNETLRELSSTLIYSSVLLIGIFAALSILHLDKAVTTVLAGAGIVGLALGFAFQDIAGNFISGIFMAVNRPIRVGELIETGRNMGIVKRIDLRTTELMSLQGLQVIIPNREIFQTVLINYTRNGMRRVDLELGVGFTEDLEKVERITLEAIGSLEERVPDREAELFFEGFGESRIELIARFWVLAKTQKQFLTMQHKAVKAISTAYADAGLIIPVPIRKLDLGPITDPLTLTRNDRNK